MISSRKRYKCRDGRQVVFAQYFPEHEPERQVLALIRTNQDKVICRAYYKNGNFLKSGKLHRKDLVEIKNCKKT